MDQPSVGGSEERSISLEVVSEWGKLIEQFLEERFGIKEKQMSEGQAVGSALVEHKHTVIARLAEIVSAANSTFVFYHGKTYSINDPACPKAAVVAYVKAQLKEMVL